MSGMTGTKNKGPGSTVVVSVSSFVFLFTVCYEL